MFLKRSRSMNSTATIESLAAARLVDGKTEVVQEERAVRQLR